jgi:hypothetical protein
LNLTEWDEPFAFDNIPNTLIDRSFHMAPPSCNGTQKNNTDQMIEVTQIVRIFFKGFRVPKDALDEAILKAEDIIAECLRPINFQGAASPIVGVFLSSADFIALDDATNDNIVICEINFAVSTALCVE